MGTEPRPVSNGDIPYLVDLAVRRYKNFQVPADKGAAFIAHAVTDPHVFFWRTGRAALVCSLTQWAFLPGQIESTMIFLVAEHGAHWEAVRLIHAALEWSRAKGATEFKISAEGGLNLGPMVRYLERRGFPVYQEAPSYSVHL